MTLFTIEAEYMMVTEVLKEIVWLLGLLNDLDVFQKHVDIYFDS